MNKYTERAKEDKGIALAIADNGYPILNEKKYKKLIVKTAITKYSGGLVKMQWLDKDNKILAEHRGTLEPEYYPIIGEVEEITK